MRGPRSEGGKNENRPVLKHRFQRNGFCGGASPPPGTLDREEIQQVLHHSNSSTVVETKNGRVVCLSSSEVKQLLGR